MKRKRIKVALLAAAVAVSVVSASLPTKTFAVNNMPLNMEGVPDQYKEYAYIPDSNLRSLLNTRYLKQAPDAPIQIIQLRRLTGMLSLGASNIKDLTGLEHCVGVNTIYLSYNKISDITPLKNLKKLQRVDLANQKVEGKDIIATGNTAVADNSILKDIDGKNIEPVKDRTNGYTYDAKTNKVTFNNITETGTRTYKFSKKVAVGSRGTVFTFSGEVTQNIIK